VLPQFAGEISRKTVNAKFLPLYQSIAQYQGVDLSRPPPAGSYLDQLCERFGIGTESGDAGRQDSGTVLSNARNFFIEHEWAIEAMRAVAQGDSTLLALGVH